MRRVFFAAAATLLLGGVSHAQDAVTSFEGKASDTLWVMDSMLVPACDAAGRTYRRIGGGEIDYKLKGDRDTRSQGTRIYREIYEATGCSAPPRRLNLQIFLGGAVTEPVFVNLPPGTSAISAGIMRDLMSTTIPVVLSTQHEACAAKGFVPGVPAFLVRDTEIVSGEPYKLMQRWVERWKYEACGQPSSIAIEFLFDGEGVTFKTTMDIPART